MSAVDDEGGAVGVFDLLFCAAPAGDDDLLSPARAGSRKCTEGNENESFFFGSDGGDDDFDIDLFALITTPARVLVSTVSPSLVPVSCRRRLLTLGR